MRLAFGAQGHSRHAAGKTGPVNFAVQHAQRVFLQARLAVFAQGIFFFGQKINQRLAVERAAFVTAQTVDFDGIIFGSESGHDVFEHQYHFRVGGRGGIAYGLGADLLKLAVTARLGAFGAEHIADIIKFLHRSGLRKIILQIRAHHARGTLGAYGQLAVAGVFKRVHFFLHDVGRLAGGFDKQLFLFHRRQAQLRKPVAAQHAAGAVFQFGK